ncbi:putative sugar O-methyltransferase [Laribacter hongkongensis]|uniref:putative sugar O-methyltransferase n=1 Tax=Laribacter hongkongensis TaxID=168471 RepID=UPI001EFDB68B|nr:putative sugar O-methyltransferase [Laribacter hongkongensis]MCG9101358.1 putative sugar O-methyltransferase [Laribacter hongkongensis]MCG9104080.1 putative sugar O-methyltransferase [Laribacter hongkongensis]MCG9113444.1 putative sugar O-methyltransferase [Laribacter hongkongensis]MCG9118916.1 putative sugar O-methyltransferase [Laribacter hongkongensis]
MLKKYPELDLAIQTMKLQSELYCPTAFWEGAASTIVEELKKGGVKKFRSLPSMLDYFVPTYGTPGSGFSQSFIDRISSLMQDPLVFGSKQKMAVDQFFSGYLSALSDYRVLLAADDVGSPPYLQDFSESSVGFPVEHFEFDGRLFSRSSLNYLLGLCFLKRHLGGDVPKIVLEVGGGFGSLGEILTASGIVGLKYIDIDIPPTSFVAQYYLSEVLGAENVATFAKTNQMKVIEIDKLPPASVLCSWQIEKLQGEVDLFVNFISFQEMEPHIVRNYLSHVSRLGARWVLLRNLREGKQRRQEHSVGVEAPILGDDYLDMLPEYDFIGRSIWPFGYKTVDGFNSELLLLRRRDC